LAAVPSPQRRATWSMGMSVLRVGGYAYDLASGVVTTVVEPR
jgi:hypothetical protein